MSLLDILAWIVLLILVASSIAIFFIMGRLPTRQKNHAYKFADGPAFEGFGVEFKDKIIY